MRVWRYSCKGVRRSASSGHGLYLKDKKGTLKSMATALHQLGSEDKYRLLTVMAKGPIFIDGQDGGFAVQPHSWPINIDDKVIKVLEDLATEGKLNGDSRGGAGGDGDDNQLSKAYRGTL